MHTRNCLSCATTSRNKRQILPIGIVLLAKGWIGVPPITTLAASDERSSELHCIVSLDLRHKIWTGINPSSSLLRNSPSFCIYLSITRLSSLRVIVNTNQHKEAKNPIQSRNRVVLVILRKEMLEGKAVVGETDMRQAMQKYALDLASKALDCFDVTDATEIARFIKKEFDRAYGIGWQCIVGTDFGSFVTHHYGCFIYFCIGSLAILLFKGSPVPVADEEAKKFLKLEPVKA